jgi:hypothetical protein
MGGNVGTVHAPCRTHKTQLRPQGSDYPSMGTLLDVGRLVGVTRSAREIFSFQMYTELFLVLMFASNALSSGALVSVPELRTVALCYPRQ